MNGLLLRCRKAANVVREHGNFARCCAPNLRVGSRSVVSCRASRAKLVQFVDSEIRLERLSRSSYVECAVCSAGLLYEKNKGIFQTPLKLVDFGLSKFAFVHCA